MNTPPVRRLDDWLTEAAALRQRGADFVIITIIAVRGSSPQKSGTRLLLAADEIIGTIGGGNLEDKAIQHGREILENAVTAPALQVKTVALSASLGQCCGGKVVLSFEPVLSEKLRLAIFGAGHIGQALAPVLARLPYQTVFYDSRPQWLQNIAGEDKIKTKHTEDETASAEKLPANTGVLVMTHSHALDMDICATLLARDDIPFVALIGSESKARRFREQLKRRGINTEHLFCPIGKSKISVRQPEKIAVQIAAALISHMPQNAEPSAQEQVVAMRLLEE